MAAEKSIEKQRTACDTMIPAEQTNTDLCVGGTCTTNKICSCAEKQEGSLYSFARWCKHNELLLTQSVNGHVQLNVAEYKAQRAVNTFSAAADQCMADSARQLAGTTRNIDAWRADIHLALNSARDEIHSLSSSKKKIQTAQMALRVICSINEECLERRASRLEVDRTRDPGQLELIKEKKLITKIGDLMCEKLSQLKEQMDRNKRAKHRLEMNWSDKNQSFGLDVINLGLNAQSPIKMSHPDVLGESKKVRLSVSQWENATKASYDEALKTLNESKQFRSLIDYAVLERSSKRLRDQADAVDLALSRFISDTQHARLAIEHDLEHVVRRLGDSERVIADLLRLKSNLENAKKIAETRLYNRQKRPEGENCNDRAQLSIISEVENLQERLKTLNNQLKGAQVGHFELLEVRTQLEDEARIKRNTLYIDIDRCQKARSHYPSQNTMIGH